MRLMQMYRIENQFATHRRRLHSIKKNDCKKQVMNMTMRHFDSFVEHRKKKINSQLFKERQFERKKEANELIHKTISTRVNFMKKDNQLKSTMSVYKKHPVISKSNSQEKYMILQENQRFVEKLENIKSQYKNYRRVSEACDLQTLDKKIEKKARSTHKSERQKLAMLYTDHFKKKPRVTFFQKKNINNKSTEELNLSNDAPDMIENAEETDKK